MSKSICLIEWECR